MNTYSNLISRLYTAFKTNYDEYIPELEDPAMSLVLVGFDDMPDNAPEGMPENVFVDELFAYEEDINNGCGLQLCFASEVKYGDGIESGYERCDEMDVEDLNEEYLEKLVNFVENHKPIKVIDCNE